MSAALLESNLVLNLNTPWKRSKDYMRLYLRLSKKLVMV